MTIEDRALDSPTGSAAEHARQYLESDGAAVDHPAVGSLLLLYTTGRISGQIRRAPLRFFEVDDDLVIVASARGSVTHPDWYTNLLDQPKVWVRRDADLYQATAVSIDAPERDELWETVILARAPQFAEYQAKTERTLPLVRLIAKS